MGELTMRDFDTCLCGDYRRDHKGGSGPCLHNKPRDLTHGYRDCDTFRLSQEATEIPAAFLSLSSRVAEANHGRS